MAPAAPWPAHIAARQAVRLSRPSLVSASHRLDPHAYPEIGFEQIRTAGIVADVVTEMGIEVHPCIDTIGVGTSDAWAFR